MKFVISRRSIIDAILIVALLVAIPGALRRLVTTGDFYLFTRHFFEDMFARLSGPGRLRFIVQPTVAVLLGVRDGMREVRAGGLPFLRGFSFQKKGRQESLRSTFESIRELVSMAILLDLISQFLIFHRVHPAAALLLGPVLIAAPYTMSRILAGRAVESRPIAQQ
jgi:hypothetical protein